MTGLPTVGLALTVKVTASASGEMDTVADADACAPLALVAVTLIVLLPFVEYVVLKLEPVPLAGDPPVAVQANV